MDKRKSLVVNPKSNIGSSKKDNKKEYIPLKEKTIITLNNYPSPLAFNVRLTSNNSYTR